MKKRPAILAAILVSFAPLAAAAVNLQDGLWEITVKTEMPGMAMPPMKTSQCLTQKDYLPERVEKNQDCKMADTKVEGNTVNWTMECREKGAIMKTTGKVTYNGSSFSGASRMTVQQPGQAKMEMANQMSGKRLGPCNK